MEPTDKYSVQMRSQTRATRVNLAEVHGAKKMIITNMPIEKQKP